MIKLTGFELFIVGNNHFGRWNVLQHAMNFNIFNFILFPILLHWWVIEHTPFFIRKQLSGTCEITSVKKQNSWFNLFNYLNSAKGSMTEIGK